eukprot:1158848-Pelagomonas_calceolata.AAC.13
MPDCTDSVLIACGAVVPPQEAHRVYPVSMDVISWLGAFHVRNEVYEKAMPYFDLASKIQPQEVKWGLMVASCLRRVGAYPQVGRSGGSWWHPASGVWAYIHRWEEVGAQACGQVSSGGGGTLCHAALGLCASTHRVVWRQSNNQESAGSTFWCDLVAFLARNHSVVHTSHVPVGPIEWEHKERKDRFWTLPLYARAASRLASRGGGRMKMPRVG